MESFYELDFDGFVKELKQKITPKLKLEWLEVFEETKKSLQEIQTQIIATDKEIKIVEGRWKERQFFLIWRNLKTMLS